MATFPRSTLRYRPITDWLDQSKKPVAERRSRQERACEKRFIRRSQTPLADVCETRPGDNAWDEEADWEEKEPLPSMQVSRDGRPRAGVSAASRRPPTQAPRTHKQSRLLWIVMLSMLIPLLLGLYSLAWHFHAQGAQDVISSRFGNHAPMDTLVLGNQVVLARNNGKAITVFFIPASGGQGSTLVQTLSGSEWGMPSLVIPTLSLEKDVLSLKLVGVPTYPNWAQPTALYRLESTANGYQAVAA